MLIDIDNFHRVLCLTLDINSKQNVLDKIKILEGRTEIIIAEPDYIETLEIVSNDPFNTISNQWGLNGTRGISANKTWNITTGNNRVLVGIIDSGIDGHHPDLINNINEDLHRDYVDTPLLSNVRKIDKDDLEDLNGHGTHVAGIVGAQGNNNVGVSGVAWDVSLVSLRVFDANGEGNLSDLKRAIDFATEEQIPILNYSGGGTKNHNGTRKAIENYPGLFVCSAGNNDQDNDIYDYYPANYNFNNVITVGAIKSDGNRPTVSDWGPDNNGNPQGSNYGANNVDIFAPGQSILSTYPTALYDSSSSSHKAVGYRFLSGTSMATPFVTGVAALMLSANPDITPQQIKFTIMNNATKYSALDNLCVSEGRLDAFKSVSAAVFNTSTVNDDIKINGFVSGYSMIDYTNLEIPESFAQISSEYGTPIQEIAIIGTSAFKDMGNLKSIIIPNTVTHVDSSAFENCSYLQSVTLPANLVAIGSSAFKGCGSLATITIPNGVTHIDSSAFENCSYLQSVTLPSSLIVIGSSAFKGCGSLGNITIPNSVTNIDSSAFENCSYLQTIILSSNLNAIGVSAFKGCGSLGSITIPSSVQYIDDSAFENCVSLVSVIVEREISNITNLGNYAFAGCSSALQIIVPQNRVAEYKNKVYWSSYKNIIIPDNDNYDEIDLYCLIDDEKSVTLNAGYNKLYKLVVDCTKSYKFVTDTDTKINIYNLDMTNAYSGENTLIAYLNKGTYYLSIEYSSVTASGTININYELTYPTDGIAIAYNSSNGTNIASGLHLTENNMYHARLKYTNYNGAGFYKFTLNAGASAIYPANAIQVYTDANRNNLLSIYSLSEVNKFAQSNENENIMYIYLPENGTYYIDVTLPLSSYPILTFNIQSIEVNNINYLNSLTSIGFDVLFENENTQSRFEEVTISHRSEIQLDILTNGTINNNIKVYVLEKVRDPGYEPGINYYYIESIYIDEITSTNRGPVFTIVLDPGTYYFGYAENEDNVNINFALRRMVDYNMNMQGVLVADPYYTGYDLGTEVLFNSGECDEYTITEGFTRNIYLMVEDRLRDPMSRLDYDWYSSNESVATVTNYGTILAMPVTEDTEVTIYAVLKDDPKIVYYRTFTVLNDVVEDLIEIELNMSYSYATKNGTYQLELTNTNCPYPMIQYYSWNIINDSDETVTMNNWGEITSTGRCTVLIEGTYNLNSRVRLYITLIIE